jgi:hypothetical protein
MIRTYWMHAGIMLLLSFLFAAVLAWPYLLSGQGVMLWLLCLVAIWLFIGTPVGVWGSIIAVAIGLLGMPFLLAKLSKVSRKMLWVSVAIDVAVMTLSFFAARGMVNAGMLM